MQEKELYKWLKSHYVDDLVLSSSEFSIYDCYSVKYRSIFELKSRDTHYDTLMIEQPKFSKLVELAKSKKCNAFYVCYTPEGVYSFNLLKIRPKFSTFILPSSSYNWNAYKKEKIVAMLRVSEAKKLL